MGLVVGAFAVAIGAFLAGLFVGDDSRELGAAIDRAEIAETRAAELSSEVLDLESEVEDLARETEELRGDQSAESERLESREKELDERAAALSEREQAVEEREQALAHEHEQSATTQAPAEDPRDVPVYRGSTVTEWISVSEANRRRDAGEIMCEFADPVNATGRECWYPEG